MKRPTFILPNGQRTSITITEFQNFVIKVLAHDFVKAADEFINKQKQNRHIQKVQEKLDHLRAKKEGLTGKKRRWCNYQISRKSILLNKLKKLQERDVV